MATKRTYHVHKPNPSGKPRALHPAQTVGRASPDGLHRSGLATVYAAQALDAIRTAQQRDPHATSTRYLLPNDGQQASAAREVIAEHLHALGAIVGPLQRTRGTRQPFAVITWPVGWTAPENPTNAQGAPGEEKDDERSN